MLRFTFRRFLPNIVLLVGLTWIGLAPAPLRAASRLLDDERTRATLGYIRLHLAHFARDQVRAIALQYLRSDPARFPSIRALGTQLVEELDKPSVKLDFSGIVTHNPAFWAAERELSPDDPSLPYLVAMLAVLADDRVTAARMIALAQATLPLTPMGRRIYSRPEALLLHSERLFIDGMPRAASIATDAECELWSQLARDRIRIWSNRPFLVTYLINVAARKAQLAPVAARSAPLQEHLRDAIKLTDADLEYLRRNDPIIATGMDDTVAAWIAEKTLAQRWIRWISWSEPAEVDDVERSVAAFEANGRADLAWLTWRAKRVLTGNVGIADRDRWKKWCRTLLDPASAAYVENLTSKNPHSGQAAMPVLDVESSKAWSGDQRIHPFLAVQVERQLANADAELAIFADSPRLVAAARFQRAGVFASINATENSRSELKELQQLVGTTDAIVYLESRLLALERHYPESRALILKLKDKPKLSIPRDGVLVGSANDLFMAGNYALAHEEYLAFAKTHPEDGYRSIMADLTARRVGRREIGVLRAALAKAQPDSWATSGIRFLLGEIDQDELLQRARRGTLFEIVQHECEATFWLGQVALAEGRRNDGLTWLTRCIGTGFTSFVEFLVADAELERMGTRPPPHAPPRDSWLNIPA